MTHWPKRSCLFQDRDKDDNEYHLQLRKRKLEAIWQSTFSLDHFIRSCQHIRRDRHANLFAVLRLIVI